MGYRIGFGHDTGHRLGFTFDPKKEVHDVSDVVRQTLLLPMNEDQMQFIPIGVIGLPGTGKTQLCAYLTYMIEQFYGAENCEVMVTDSIEVYFKKMDRTHMIKIVTIDDAASKQNSMDGSKNKELYNQWHEIRHITERYVGRTGMIFAIFNVQRTWNLHANFRNSFDHWFFVSPANNRTDIRAIIDVIGNNAYEELRKLRRDILRGNNDLKVRSIACIPSYGDEGTGWFFREYLPIFAPDWPHLQKFDDPLTIENIGRTLTKEDILSTMSKEKEWTDKVNQYIRHKNGDSQEYIGYCIGKTQSMVSKNITEVTKEIDRRILADS